MAERYEYTKGRLLESEVSPNPNEQFAHWLQEAIAAQVVEPTAMCLSTVDADGSPSSRIVLLRGHDDVGFTFFTNYLSRKGKCIAENPQACANFWWGGLERQIRVEGSIARVSAEESDSYWQGRPLESRYASAASPQSQVIQARNEIESEIEHLRQEHPTNIPRPEHWGGYRLVPNYFEFWQGGAARLHDRIAYTLSDRQWTAVRLAP